MDVDPHVLLCLLAVRQFGGRGVPAKQDLFAKGLKTALQTAVAKNWLRAEKTTVQTGAKTKAGKPKTARVDVLDLTPEGEEMLLRAARPETLAAVTAFQASALGQRLEADRELLRAEVLAAVNDKTAAKDKGVPAKEIAAIVKAVADLGKRLAKVETALQAGGTEPILEKIDQAFAGLQAKLDAAVHGGATPGERVVHAVPPPAAPTPALKVGLRRAYEDLCQLIEFEDHLVPLPRLYHQARHLLPGLSVEAFHRELHSLWDQGELELQLANDVRDLREQEKGIRRGDNLYYYVLWHKR